MSIASELQDLNDNILGAYSAVNTKGGTVPANKNTANLATAITSIPSGGGGGGEGTEDLTEVVKTITSADLSDKIYTTTIPTNASVVKIGVPSASSQSNTDLYKTCKPEIIEISRMTADAENLEIKIYFDEAPSSTLSLSVFYNDIFDGLTFGNNFTNKEKAYALLRKMLIFPQKVFPTSAEVLSIIDSDSVSTGFLGNYNFSYWLNAMSIIGVLNSLSVTDAQFTDFLKALRYALNASLNSRASYITDSNMRTLIPNIFTALGATACSYAAADSTAFAHYDITASGGSIFLANTSSEIMDPYLYNDKSLTKILDYYVDIANIASGKMSDTTNFTYDSANSTILVSGSGRTMGTAVLTNFQTTSVPVYGNATSATSIVFGPNITEFDYDSCEARNYIPTPSGGSASERVMLSNLQNFVFMQPANASVTLKNGGTSGKNYTAKTPSWFYNPKSAPSTPPTFNIYTDNNTIKNFSFTANATINFYPLSDWEGPLVS